MKRIMTSILSLALALLLCAGAAVAETADDVSYTMAEKLMKQLNAGSGFAGTLTLIATAAEGREDEAYTTLKPLVMDWTYIKVRSDADAPEEMRLNLLMDSGDYQQGSAEVSVRDGAVYLKSSLLGDVWYLLGDDALKSALVNQLLPDALPAVSALTQTGGMMSGTASFFLNMATYLIGGSTDGMSDAMQQYTTKLDFWLEGYRDSVQITSLDDGTSAMKIEYHIPPAAVKAQLKQLLIDLMNDDTLRGDLAALMPEEQAARFLTPSLQPYYFYAVDELPLENDMTIYRDVSMLGDTIGLSVAMPLYDSESGPLTLLYSRSQGGEDMPFDNTLSLTGEGSYLGIDYHTYETITGATVYQGTLRYESPEADGVKAKTLLMNFSLTSESVTTKDLNGYETLNQSLKLTVAPAEIPDTEDASLYTAFSKTVISLDMRCASLAAKNAPTDMTLSLSVSGDGMAQDILLVIEGATTGLWTPEAFDTAQATDLAQMPEEELQALVSQAVVNAGLLFLPYVNLPKITTDSTN